MIRSFRSRALKRFWERNDGRQLAQIDLARIARILRLVDNSTSPSDLNLPGLHFHKLSGDMADRYAVTVRANWRITFAWSAEDATDIDYEDYH